MREQTDVNSVSYVRPWMAIVQAYLAVWAFGSVSVEASAPRQISPLPKEVRDAGFSTETFSTTSFSNANVSLNQEPRAKSRWFFWSFFGWRQPRNGIEIKADGTINVTSSITTAALAKNPAGFVGTAFGGGGYFEAELAFDPANIDLSKGWPAWWALTLDSILEKPNSYWKGQSKDYRNTAEVDFFEYLEKQTPPMRNKYGAGLHHWYGRRGQCGGPNLCGFRPPRSVTVRFAPPSVDWSKFHRLGALWIPATDSRRGSLTFYLDRHKTGETIYWTKFSNQPPPPSPKTPWAFGILDQQHLVLVLGSGTNEPMRVRSVRVWQRDRSQNLVSTTSR